MVVCQAYAIPSFDSLRSGETGKDDRRQRAESELRIAECGLRNAEGIEQRA